MPYEYDAVADKEVPTYAAPSKRVCYMKDGSGTFAWADKFGGEAPAENSCLLASAIGDDVSDYTGVYKTLTGKSMPKRLRTAIAHADANEASPDDVGAIVAGAQALGVKLVLIP